MSDYEHESYLVMMTRTATGLCIGLVFFRMFYLFKVAYCKEIVKESIICTGSSLCLLHLLIASDLILRCFVYHGPGSNGSLYFCIMWSRYVVGSASGYG